MISAAEKKALKALCGKRPKAELKTLFALVRANTDRALLAAIAPPRPQKAKRAADPLLREVEASLRPLMAPGAEKAELLLEHLAKRSRRKLPGAPPRGLADALKRLRAAGLTEVQIKAGAAALMAKLAQTYDGRESVV